MNSVISIHTIRFILLAITQALIFNHINFLGYINPYPYLLFILFYPVKNNRMLFIFLSFLLGLTVDMFLDSGGIHAAASVLVAYARPIFLKSTFGTIYEYQTIKFNNVEFGSKLTYIAFLTTIHHIVLFTLETFSTSKIILTLQKALFSSIFTILLCILLTIIFSRNKT
ncbi:rod shape-determining protein MreD [Aestuariivivens insulae]|uniref:rod shape-determining protein MreD n=1 Tax=Aestuariivivens insulae TaxID=1621988 RepID=UPI001F5906E7|nr:rod shape-determining protein MreD [Aestuariivivens insulae]